MMNTPPRKNSSGSRSPHVDVESGWGTAVRFIGNGFGLRGKNRPHLNRKQNAPSGRVHALAVEASSKEIALYLLRIYRVRQAVEETLAGLIHLIDDLKTVDTPEARQAISGLRRGSISDAISYYRLYAENKAKSDARSCRLASEYFANEAVLIFLRSLPAALQAGELATQTDPSYQRAWEVYGTLQMCCGQFTAAENSFSRAHALAP